MTEDFRNIYLTLLLIFSDAFFYGYCHEIKGWFKKTLFREWKPSWTEPDEVYVPYYRALQWSLDVLALYLVWITGWIPFAGMLLSWYFLTKEGGFYLVLGQWSSQEEHKRKYWLQRGYFSGFWLFVNNSFTKEKFAWSCLTGLFFLIISNLFKSI